MLENADLSKTILLLSQEPVIKLPNVTRSPVPSMAHGPNGVNGPPARTLVAALLGSGPVLVMDLTTGAWIARREAPREKSVTMTSRVKVRMKIMNGVLAHDFAL